jgi:TPR repeat protein
MRIAAALMVLACVCTLVAYAEEAGSPEQHERERADFVTQGLLDPGAPADRRTELAARLEALALERNDADLLYVVGSLYRLGREASLTSPYPRDLDKAREYLSRAALKGRRGAMGKLALLELDAGNRFEANVWAQLQAHYEREFARGRKDRDGKEREVFGVANILALTQDGFPKDEVPKLEERIRMIIGTYDTSIREGMRRLLEAQARSPLRNARLDRCHLPQGQLQVSRARRAMYLAGGAEYYVAFADDGSADRTWLLDVWPDVRMERGLRTCAGRYRVEPTEALAGKGLVALLPMAINDSRVTLSTPDSD